MTASLISKHVRLLRQGVAASLSRQAFVPYAPVTPRADASDTQLLAAYRDAQFYLDQPSVIDRAGSEHSTFGFALNVKYPHCQPEALIGAAWHATSPWTRFGTDGRAAVCMEILARLHAAGDELFAAVMHVSGQPPAVAAYVGVDQALARGFEAICVAWREMHVARPRVDDMGAARGSETPIIERRYEVAPRGVALVAGCDSLPTWLGLPAIMANLVTGNGVVVVPSPKAILPLAMVVASARQVLKEFGGDPNLISLLVADQRDEAVRFASRHHAVALVDGIPSSVWLGARGDDLVVSRRTPTPGFALLDATDDYAGMLRYVAMSGALDSGRLPGAAQVLVIAAAGVATPDGIVPPEVVARDLAAQVARLAGDSEYAAAVFAAVPRTGRADSDDANTDQPVAGDDMGWVRTTEWLEHPRWPGAWLRVPSIGYWPAADGMPAASSSGWQIRVVPTMLQGIAALRSEIEVAGCHALVVYSANEQIVAAANALACMSGATLSVGLVSSYSQAMSMIVPAAFADFCPLADGPAATTLVDAAYVVNRLAVVESRRMRRER